MRKRITAALWIWALLLCACGPSTPFDSEGLNDFERQFRTATKSANLSTMLELYHLEGTDQETLRMLRAALQTELGLPITQITFEPLTGSPDERIDYEHEGQRYGPTLEPKLRMRVRYATEDRFTSLFTLGQRYDGAWRIISSRPRED